MTRAAAQRPALPAAGLLARLEELVRHNGITTIVQAGAGQGELTAGLAALAERVVALDVRPEAVAAARARCGRLGLGNVRVLQGYPPRLLADLAPQIPPRTLYYLGAAGSTPNPVREELFRVPRAQGLLAIELDPAGGVGGYGDVQGELLRWSPDHRVELYAAPGGPALLLAWPRPRVHVTFLIEEYTAEYGKSGISINLDNLVATLDQTGFATWNVVHYDRCFHEGRPIPLAEIGKPPGADAHVLVCTCHYHSHANPAPSLLWQAKATGTKVAFMWLDKKLSQSTPEYYRVADVNVVLDGNDFELPGAWPAFTPKNPIHFHDPGLPREIDVSLAGEVRHLSQRQAYARRLAEEKRIAVRLFPTSAADPKLALTVGEYARIYQTSKISLALTKDAVRQLKGRVFEIAHCGALLMCDVNHHVQSYFVPGEEYVEFCDYEDLVAKCRHYLAHDGEREAIARAGHRKAAGFYNHRLFWQSLLARLGATAASLPRGEGSQTDDEA